MTFGTLFHSNCRTMISKVLKPNIISYVRLSFHIVYMHISRCRCLGMVLPSLVLPLHLQTMHCLGIPPFSPLPSPCCRRERRMGQKAMITGWDKNNLLGTRVQGWMIPTGNPLTTDNAPLPCPGLLHQKEPFLSSRDSFLLAGQWQGVVENNLCFLAMPSPGCFKN